MIVTATGETTCPECDLDFEFEVDSNEGEINLECPACHQVHEVAFRVVVETL